MGMSEAKFIKHPWVPYFGGSGIVEVHNYDGVEVVSWQGFDGNECTESENISHAHLIAAAPDMYEMLDSMIEQFEYDGCTEYEFKLLASAKNILAKARGELA